MSTNFGIGTTNPQTKLDVNGKVTATAFSGPLTGNAATATVATTVTITDNESTNEDNAIIFAAGGDVDGGNLGLESDGNLTYNPSTGKITATGFISNGGTISYGSNQNATLSVAAVSEKDTAGKNLTIAAGQGIGTGTGGSIIFQTADASGSSGSSANSLATAMTIADDDNVGIGTTSPAGKIDIVNNQNNGNMYMYSYQKGHGHLS